MTSLQIMMTSLQVMMTFPQAHLMQWQLTRVFNAGCPCDATGQFLEDGAPPTPPPSKLPDDWTPYQDRVEFETAEFLYTCNQMSTGDMNILLDLWAATLLKHNDKPPFVDCRDLYKTIDVKCQSFQVKYMGEKPADNVPPWMDESHNNMLGNSDYAMEMDYQPYHEFLTDGNECQWQDFMSGDWAWNQADKISNDLDTNGLTFVPVILGSDKMTVSVATGANNYYPLYVPIRNVCNNIRRAHHDAVAIFGFLAMPKTTKEYASCPNYRKYHQQLFHSFISNILNNLRPGMTKPEIVCFSDGHYRCIICGLGPYIAYYEEQVLLACIVRSWCSRCMSHHKDLDSELLYRNHDYTEAHVEEVSSTDLWDKYGIINDLVITDIHKLIVLDLLHQLIEGTFKDHLVEWVGKYLHHVRQSRIAVVASFSGLQCFLQGQGFKQWTTDDSKALMKVYLPAIEGHIPTDVMHTFCMFLEFCYLIWHNIITESTLVQIQDTLNQFHHYRKIFESTGVILTFSLPRQHSSVKELWRCSSYYKALGQMLVANQCLDKLAALCIDFKSYGMLHGTCLSETLRALNEFDSTIGDNEEGEVIDSPMVVQAHIQLAKTPFFNCASSIFYAPSDHSGIGGMHREYICTCPLWRNEVPCYDCVFVNTDAGIEGMGGMDIARVMCFFSFMFKAVLYPCTMVHWFDKVNDGPNEDTGMWIVQPSYDVGHSWSIGIIHVDSIYHAAHLIPIYGTHAIPQDLKHYDSYDAFQAFYVNKFADHHAFEIAS
ncbi:hypothetical protein DFH29DRAFT_983647 [Suillus ampliporus]|nr:hypothetical protein DFH29DRAFT_983647 [Suillus ampliporus]